MDDLPIAPPLVVVQTNGEEGFRLEGVAKLVNGCTISTLVPEGITVSVSDLVNEIIRRVNADNPALPGRHFMATEVAIDSGPGLRRLYCYFVETRGPIPDPPILGYLRGGASTVDLETARSCNMVSLPVAPGHEQEIEAGKMVYLDKNGNAVGSIGLTRVDFITHGGDTATFCPRGTFEIDLEVHTASGLKPIRASVTLRPGGQVSFFSAPGKEHWATVALDGRTLTNITPPIDIS